MKRIHHLNCVRVVIPMNDDIIGHCLLIEENDQLVLIDTGVGIQDVENPDQRLGKDLIEAVGFQLDIELTAFHQIQKLGLNPAHVKHCIISHLDPDHTGGLADFPDAAVHCSTEELINFYSENPRYLQGHLAHHPEIIEYSASDKLWFGLEARRIHTGLETEIMLIPLFGHTLGHCGVAIHWEGKWLLYVGDAYYLRAELEDEYHPVSELTAARADDNEKRLESLEKLKKLVREHPEIEVFGYHDREEFSKFTVGKGLVFCRP
ncbi:glyoxylase-like metal-dependent hydrolase (beta-lactamase superfamily II) [Chryseobacterium rhizosphaerae]|uniref:MBL fold metallo-hydrolase n=1 Tax=Chryseobacterium rhizosphaerae TaxID=395937 RepID=UPI002858539F|nr:MBL fold metallo-hydrolase [Chryseobacterium rhizosphaerae]MDR6545200.1 glyoxylase-like metal-dependent hydrolase (beta-lactamase superfamily II) [Chryseobacterium rhizosphaerae]